MSKIFERASKMKLRFQTPIGNLSTEDLWDMPLTGGNANLNDMAKYLSRELKSDNEEDFVNRDVKPNADLTLRFDIVKRVIEVKLTNKDTAEKREKTRQRNARIRELMAQKQDETLAGKSLEELEALLAGDEE